MGSKYYILNDLKDEKHIFLRRFGVSKAEAADGLQRGVADLKKNTYLKLISNLKKKSVKTDALLVIMWLVTMGLQVVCMKWTPSR